MKILFITPQPPEVFGGGGLVVLSHLNAFLEKYKFNLIYIGPKSKTIDLESLNIECFLLEKTNFYNKASSVFTQENYTTLGLQYYIIEKVLNKYKNSILFAFIEFSKTSNIVKILKEKNIKVYLFSHNFELKYYKNSEKNIYKIYKNAIEKNEKESYLYADKIFALDDFYIKDALNYYKINNKIEISKVFYYKNVKLEKVIDYNSDKINIFTSGSFKYGHTYKLFNKFLREFKNINVDNNVYFFISGSKLDNIDNEIFELNNIVLINRPESEDYFLKLCDYYLNYTISESGVLIRILSAIVCNVPIISTSKGIRGYNIKDSYYEINSFDEIENLIHIDFEKHNFIRKRMCENFYLNHSFESGINNFNRIIE